MRTAAQWNRFERSVTPVLMARRNQRGPTDQRRITLPVHVWQLLDQVAELQSEAYVLMGGKTQFTVSDLLETGAEMYLRSLLDEFGTLPNDDSPAATRKEFVKRLAESNRKQLVEQLLSPKEK